MSEIYEQANHLVIWLGSGDNETQLALRLLGEYQGAGAGESPLRSNTITRSWLDIRIAKYGKSKVIDALMSFYSIPWFVRCWVVQEYVLGGRSRKIPANSYRSTFCCGPSHITDGILHCEPLLEEVVIMYRECNRDLAELRILNQDKVIMCIDMFERIALWVERARHDIMATERNMVNLLETLVRASWFGVSDRRDIIYAFLGLAKRFNKSSDAQKYCEDLLIAYRAPLDEVFTSQVKSIISATNRLDILGMCYHSVSTWHGAFNERSWVPAWHKNHQSGINRQSLIFRELSWTNGDLPRMPYNASLGSPCRAHVKKI